MIFWNSKITILSILKTESTCQVHQIFSQKESTSKVAMQWINSMYNLVGTCILYIGKFPVDATHVDPTS
jgi:hypothetical protein